MFPKLIFQNIAWYGWRLRFLDLKKELLGLPRFNPVRVGGTNCIAIGYNTPITPMSTNCIAIGYS